MAGMQADGEKQSVLSATALKQSLVAAAVAAGLAFPILALRAEPDLDNHLVLIDRWQLMLWAAAIVFAGNLLGQIPRIGRTLQWLLFAAGAAIVLWMLASAMRSGFPIAGRLLLTGLVAIAGGGALALTAPLTPGALSLAQTRLRGQALRIALPVGLIALFAFPLVTLWALGPAGSLKWINNYGVQILIYVMLGWGLNIVVGLAGLLDLGQETREGLGAVVDRDDDADGVGGPGHQLSSPSR